MTKCKYNMLSEILNSSNWIEKYHLTYNQSMLSRRFPVLGTLWLTVRVSDDYTSPVKVLFSMICFKNGVIVFAFIVVVVLLVGIVCFPVTKICDSIFKDINFILYYCVL